MTRFEYIDKNVAYDRMPLWLLIVLAFTMSPFWVVWKLAEIGQFADDCWSAIYNRVWPGEAPNGE